MCGTRRTLYKMLNTLHRALHFGAIEDGFDGGEDSVPALLAPLEASKLETNKTHGNYVAIGAAQSTSESRDYLNVPRISE